jgi:predicted enzyme related to lactoylglutathione lyase
MNHPVLQWQYLTQHPDRAAQFYQRVFGWESSADNALGYRQVGAGQCGIAGGYWPAPPGAPSFVQLFIGCADVAAALARATEAGAEVIVPVTPLPDGAVLAILRDPQGVSFGLLQAGT